MFKVIVCKNAPIESCTQGTMAEMGILHDLCYIFNCQLKQRKVKYTTYKKDAI